MRVRPGLSGSYEALLHQASVAGAGDFLLPLAGDERLTDVFAEPRLQRAIGVIYQPRTERWSHYFHTRLPDQFDALLHFDQTRAVEPLERTAGWETGEPAETYPTGI